MKIKAFEFIAPKDWRFLTNSEVRQTAKRAAEFARRNFHFEHLEQHVEEYLRQWVARELIEVYGYAEGWLWLADTTKRSANLVIRDEQNSTLALIAARYFGDDDLKFETACQDLQSDLEAIETARFGLVTDGRRVSFLSKTDDEQIGDYQTIADFPNAAELKIFVETKQLSALPLVSSKFQKLPAPKTAELPALEKHSAPKLPKPKTIAKKPKSVGRAISLCGGAAAICAAGVWFAMSGGGSNADAMKPTQTTVAPTAANKSDDASVKNQLVKSVVTPDKSTVAAPRQTARGKSDKNRTSREVNPDGTVKLTREDLSVMQMRPIRPAAQPPQPKVFTAPTTNNVKTVTPESERKIIQQPFLRKN